MVKHLRRKITAGLITLTPIMATIWILLFLFNFFDNLASPLIDAIIPLDIPGVGIMLTLLILYLLGVLVTNFLGKQLITFGENIINRIPFAKTIYGTAKQIVESVGTSSKKAFQKTVLIPYPHAESWTLAFVTGESKDHNGIEYYHLFVTTTPNPTTGYFLMMKKNKTIDANISVEEGFKVIISGGVIAPDINQIPS